MLIRAATASSLLLNISSWSWMLFDSPSVPLLLSDEMEASDTVDTSEVLV